VPGRAGTRGPPGPEAAGSRAAGGGPVAATTRPPADGAGGSARHATVAGVVGSPGGRPPVASVVGRRVSWSARGRPGTRPACIGGWYPQPCRSNRAGV